MNIYKAYKANSKILLEFSNIEDELIMPTLEKLDSIVKDIPDEFREGKVKSVVYANPETLQRINSICSEYLEQ